MTSGGTPAGTMGGARQPTWKERENNKRRERRRRAVAAKIFAGLRAYGNYELPKHCDNNEVLKALCREAGWTVEEDGTTYRKGCKPVERMNVAGPSASPSPCSSYQPSPCTSYQPSPCASYNPSPRASYNPSPASSSLQSPASYVTNANNTSVEPSSLLPWLKNLSSSSSSASSKVPHHLRHLYVHGGSISAPVTPPLSSPTARTPPQIKTDWDESTAPPSPGGAHQDIVPDPAAWFAGIQIASAGPSSPTFSLVSSNPFGGGSSSRMWTPGQSGTCSPAMPGGSSPAHVDVHMSDCASDEFAFGSSSNGTPPMTGLVKAWEGERIHEECVSDELELTLGNSSTRAD